jgi:hypothetical protein
MAALTQTEAALLREDGKIIKYFMFLAAGLAAWGALSLYVAFKILLLSYTGVYLAVFTFTMHRMMCVSDFPRHYTASIFAQPTSSQDSAMGYNGADIMHTLWIVHNSDQSECNQLFP